MILEACIETPDEARLAEKLGASRLELCANLDKGGTTPEFRVAGKVIESVNIPVKVMIRPRAGNFVYSEFEVEIMQHTINHFKKLPVSGFVLGALTSNSKLEMDIITQLVEFAAPLPVTIHRCIDSITDPVSGVIQLMKIQGIKSILTSGGAENAIEGADILNAMVGAANGRMEIIAAGGITRENLASVRELIHAPSFHGRRIVGNLKVL